MFQNLPVKRYLKTKNYPALLSVGQKSNLRVEYCRELVLEFSWFY